MERRDALKIAGAAVATTLLSAEAANAVEAGVQHKYKIAEIKKGSPIADHVAKLTETTLHGKISCVWPRDDGSILFELLTSDGHNHAYTFVINQKTEAMLRVLMLAYDKQIDCWVIGDETKQIANQLVLIAL